MGISGGSFLALTSTSYHTYCRNARLFCSAHPDVPPHPGEHAEGKRARARAGGADIPAPRRRRADARAHALGGKAGQRPLPRLNAPSGDGCILISNPPPSGGTTEPPRPGGTEGRWHHRLFDGGGFDSPLQPDPEGAGRRRPPRASSGARRRESKPTYKPRRPAAPARHPRVSAGAASAAKARQRRRAEVV